MIRRLSVAAAILLSAAFAIGAEQPLYQIDLVPSGRLIAKGEPKLKGTTYHYTEYPTGKLISIRKSTVKQIFKMTPEQAAAANPMNQVKLVRDVPMQGPKQSLPGGGSGAGGGTNVIGRARAAAAAANSGTAGRTSSPY